MMLTDTQIEVFVSKVLKLPPGKRKEYLRQVDNLIESFKKKVKEDESSFAVSKFRKTGSLRKGTVLKPRDSHGVDADIAVELDFPEEKRYDLDLLHDEIVELLVAVYPQKEREDFKVQPRTLGIHFRESGLDVDLVPIIPVPENTDYGWQPSSKGEALVKTSVPGQLDFIKSRNDVDPRYRTLVRLLKRWRNHQELEHLRSFTIELLLAAVQDNEGPAGRLEDGLIRFFRFAAQTELKEPISFPENGGANGLPSDAVVILDPVNSDNNVAARLTEEERKEIVETATAAWETLSTAQYLSGKGDTVEYWSEVFGRSFVIEE